MPINLKNYTTTVPVNRSVEYIEKLLMNFGATNIMKEFESGNIKSMAFRITVENVPMAFKLPARVKEIFVWMKKNNKKMKDDLLLAQSARIAWKQLYELLHLQLSMVQMDQIGIVEALLPFVYDVATNQTIYEKLKDQKFQLLLQQ